MLKKIIFAAFLLANISLSQAALPTGATLYDVNLPSLRGRALVSVRALHFETAILQSDYALTYPPNTVDSLGLTSFNEGQYHNLDPDSRWNIQISVGYIFPCTSNDITVAALNYHQRTDNFVTLDPFIGIIFPTLSGNWPALASLTISNPLLGDDTLIETVANPNLVTARSTINCNVFTLKYGQSINLGNKTRLKLFGGLRYADINHNENVIYNYSKFDPTDIVITGPSELSITLNTTTDFTETIDQHCDFKGVGPEFGADVSYYLCWGFGLVGTLSTSILVGAIDSGLNEAFERSLTATIVASEFEQLPVGTEFASRIAQRANFNYSNECRVVPNIDAKIGIDYTYQYCNRYKTRLNLELGYMVSHYFNSVDRLREISTDQFEFDTRRTLASYFDGLYFQLQVRV